MTQHGHTHHHGDHHGQPSKKGGFHRDWRVWAIVVLMIFGMVVYVVTIDDSMMPWAKPGKQIPAAVEP